MTGQKVVGITLFTLAFIGCSVPVVIFAMQTAEYVFGY